MRTWCGISGKSSHLLLHILLHLISPQIMYSDGTIVFYLFDQQAPKGKKKENVTKISRPPCPPVLDRFDEQYGRELGDIWPSAR